MFAMNACPRRRTAACLVAGAIFGLAATLSAAADGRGPSTGLAAFDDVSVVVNGYEVFANLSQTAGTPTSHVRATLTAESDQPVAVRQVSVGEDGSAAVGFVTSGLAGPHRPLLLHPGDHVRLEAISSPAGSPLSSLDLVVPMLTAELDVAAGRLSGRAPAGTQLGITARRADGTPVSPQKTTTQPDGTWQLALGGVLALEPGARGMVYFRDGAVTWQRAWVVSGFQAAIGGEAVTVFTLPGDVVAATAATHVGDEPMDWTTGVAWDGTANLVLRNALGRPQPLLSGRAVTVTRSGGPDLLLANPATRNLTIDPAADRITGELPAGTALVAELSDAAGGPTVKREVTAGADGRFTLSLAGNYDVTPATRVVLSWPQAPGLSLTAFAPRLTGRDPLVTIVTGQGVAGEVLAGLATRDTEPPSPDLAAGRATVGADGHFRLVLRPFSPSESAPPSWAPPRVLTLVHGSQSLGVIKGITPVSVEASASADTIGGKAVAGQRAMVTIGDQSRTVEVGSDGSWQVETADWADLQPGTEVSVRLVGEDGIEAALEFPVFRVSAQAGADRVRVEGPPGLAADIEFPTDNRNTLTTRCVVVRRSCEVRLLDSRGLTVTLKTGDLLSVYPSAGDTVELEMQKMNAHIDPGGNDVVGEGPPGEPVRVEFSHPEGVGIPQGGGLGTDAQGVYDFELRSSEHGLMVPGLASDVFQLRPNRHQVWARGVLEQLKLRAASAEVGALVEPLTKVQAWLNAADEDDPKAALARGEALSDRDGLVALTLADSSGNPVRPAVGQSVGISHVRGLRVVAVPALYAWRRGSAGTIVGQTSPGLAVKAVHQTIPAALAEARPEDPGLLIVRAVADQAGFFEIPAPALDPWAIARTEVVATLASGDEIRLVVPADATGSAVFLPSAGR